MTLPLILFHNQGRGRPIGGVSTYIDDVKGIESADMIGYWPMNETAGVVAVDYSVQGNDGAYTGVELANAAGPDGELCPYFDGTNDYNNMFTAGLATDFGVAGEWTIAIWMKVNTAAVWADAATRIALILYGDATNFLKLWKGGGANAFNHTSELSDTEKQVYKNSGADATWIHTALTVSEAGDKVMAYWNGAQTGTTQTSIDSWDAGALTVAIAGATNLTPNNVWHGWLAHAVVWKKALTAAQILSLATV